MEINGGNDGGCSCSVCFAPSTKFCSSCKKVFYCSPEHQKSDWKTHKKNCFPAKLHFDEIQGRHFVASRGILKGERIFREKALVVGPSGAEKYFHAICLGCYRVVHTDYVCSKCKWPVCSESCEKLPAHRDSECGVFRLRGVGPYFSQPYEYDLIKFLRSLLLREADGEKWQEIAQLASHAEARRECQASLLATMTSFEFISRTCQLTEYDYETVSHVVGVWGVNSFGANAPSGPNPTGRLASFLFPKTSLCSHNCVANTRGILLEENESASVKIAVQQDSNGNLLPNKENAERNNKTGKSSKKCKNSNINGNSKNSNSEKLKMIESDGTACAQFVGSKPVYTMELYASLPIKEGQPILITYAEVGEGTLERQKILRDHYYFSCTCPRCRDPTEFNTFFSGIKCPQCKDGYLLPENPLDTNSDWKCYLPSTTKNKTKISQDCQRPSALKFGDISSPLMKIKFELNSIGMKETESEIKKLERILSENSGRTLHRNHWLLMEVKFRLIQRLICYMPEAKNINSAIQRCIIHSEHCLEVANSIRPGYNPYRGKILYCLCQAKLQQIVRSSGEDVLFKRAGLLQLKDHVQEAQEILSKEPVGSDERVIAESIREDLKQIERIISVFNIQVKNSL